MNVGNLDRLMDKLEAQKGYRGITSEIFRGTSYVIKGNELSIVTTIYGSLNISRDNWPEFRQELDTIFESMKET